MNELNFAYWLQGYFELSKVNGEVKLTQEQINMIDRHLNLVFNKVTDIKLEALRDVKEAPEPLNVPATKVFVLGLYVNVASLSCNRP
jgi:hypothetical protein